MRSSEADDKEVVVEVVVLPVHLLDMEALKVLLEENDWLYIRCRFL